MVAASEVRDARWTVTAAIVWGLPAVAVMTFCPLGCGSTKAPAESAEREASSGCSVENAAGCGSGLVCERYGAPSCADPNWAEWPMPNAQVEVMAGAPNLESYTDNGDGTVTDNVTKLMWQQLTPTANYTQAQSISYCAQLALGGFDDWRLPAVLELISIVDTGTYNPSIDSTVFPGTPAVGFYWSTTPYAGNPGNAWGVYFNNGYSATNDTSTPYSVRCVR
jgi:hypothetical protein